MQPSVPRGRKKASTKPVIITTDTKFKPKISERTLKKRQEERENKFKPSKFASGLTLCGIIILYVLLVLVVLIGAGGIAVCAIYFNTDTSSQGWIIAGIVMGAVTLVIGVILILLTIFKQARNRPWQYKKKEKVNTYDDALMDSDDDDEEEDGAMPLDDSDDEALASNIVLRENSPTKPGQTTQASGVQSASIGKRHEMASSPLRDPLFEPLHRATFHAPSEMIFCPGCNRVHPSTHQCMYQTRVANGFGNLVRPAPAPAPRQDSIAIQTEDEVKKKKKNDASHTVIDRSLKYSYTTETQTDVTAKPGSNVTESVILRRVPIPTAKVVVQQPTTKVMIVKVPNTAGQLVIQPKATITEEPLK